jgi:hypothetical protein
MVVVEEPQERYFFPQAAIAKQMLGRFPHV